MTAQLIDGKLIAQQVRDEVRRMIDEIGAGGGYIIAPSHDMPGDIPIENLVAFIETARSQ